MKLGKKLKVLALTTVSSMLGQNYVYATDDFDPRELGDYDNGMFDELTSSITTVGGSAYKASIKIGIIALVFTIISLGFSILIFHSGTKKDEHKSSVFWIAVAATCIFGATSIVFLVKGIFGV